MRNKYPWLAIGCITGLLFVLLWINVKASSLRQTTLPSEGWRVCRDLGVGSIPDLGEDRQRFAICLNPPGWEVQAYCLNPGDTPPEEGAYCSLLGGNTFWCGDAVQQLRLYAILQIPPTPTSTPTATSTATATATFLPTASPVPSQTPRPAATQARTPTQRVVPGGPGNRARITFEILLGGLIFTGLAAWLWKRSRRA